MRTKLLGAWGEALALDYLRSKKYSPVAMGYRTRFGEIDIIVKNRKYIVFTEVKLRKDSTHGNAGEYVTRDKQQKIKLAAEEWLQHNETKLQPRFDVIEIYAPEGLNTLSPEINHIENAF